MNQDLSMYRPAGFSIIYGLENTEGDLSHLKTCSSSHRCALDFFAIQACMVGATGMAGMQDICMAQRSKRDHLQSVHKRYQ